MPRSNIQLRLAGEADAGIISQIYNYFVERSTCTFALEPEAIADRVAWLSDHDHDHPVIVCTHEGQVIAWGALTEWNSRPAYRRTVEVSFYVHHDWHRQGIGRRLLAELIDRATEIGHHVVIGGACTEQVASIRLQESFGFTQVACFREVGYKFGRWLDVVYLQRILESPTVYSSK